MPLKILFLFGTRPEAIKLSPVVLHMRSRPSEFSVRVAVTAQHRRLLDQALATFDIRPDYDLDVMRSGQSLLQSSARILAALEDVLNSTCWTRTWHISKCRVVHNPYGDGRASERISRAILSFFGSAQEFDRAPISCGFLKGYEFYLGGGQALSLQQ